jgi:hypothetical protein
VVGVVLLLVTPLLNGIMQHPRIAILSAASGLTIIIWVVALAMIRSLPGAPTVSTTPQEGKLEPFTEGTFGILVLPFEGSTPEEQEKGVKIQGTITKTLSARLRELQIADTEVRAAPVSMVPLPHTHADARTFGVTVQVVETEITPLLAPSEHWRGVETGPLPHVEPLHTLW